MSRQNRQSKGGHSTARQRVLDEVAAGIPAPVGSSCIRVGIDGPDGSGKTTFADELAEVLRQLGRSIIRLSADDFHNVRAIRYRRGRESPAGFWLDSYDYRRLIDDALLPLGPGGSNRYRSAAHDLQRDEVIDPPWLTAAPGSVVVVDGLFLHRGELVGFWDFSVFLHVPFDVTARRMALRDATNPDPDHPSMRRYVEAQRIYFRSCNPQGRATMVIDNTDLAAPSSIRDIDLLTE